MDRIRPLTGIAEVEAIEAAIDSIRDRCLFLVGIQSGLRGSELVAIRVGDARRTVSNDGSLSEAQAWQRKARPDSHDVQPMQARLSMCLDHRGLKALAQLLGERASAPDDDPLFVTADGRGLSQVTLTRLWTKWGAKGGLTGRLTAHSGRLTFLARMGHLPLIATVVQPTPYDFREPMN